MLLNILEITIFLEGLVSLISIISYKGFLLVHVFLIVNLTLSLIYIFVANKIFVLNNKWLKMVLLAFVFYFATLIGATNSNDFQGGLIASQLFLLTFSSIILYYIIDNDNLKFILIFVKGFIYSAVITSLYTIIDTLHFYLGHNHKSLNVIIFPKYLMLKANGHYLSNFQHIDIIGHHLLLYRSSGFSWEPGVTFPAVVITLILLNENIIIIKYKLLLLLIIFIALIVSISKVSLVALLIYFLIRIFKNKNVKLTKTIKIKALNFLPFLSFIFLFFIGFFIPYLTYTDANFLTQGNERHLKYFSSVIDYYKANISQILFGFGYRGVGEFFNKYVVWRTSTGFRYLVGYGPPSALTDLFLWGGLVGIIFWFYSYYVTFINGSNGIKLIMIILIFLMFGGTINSVWFNSIYISIFIMSYSKKLNKTATI